MKFLKDLHENNAHHFEEGGKLEFFYPLFEAQYTGLFTPGDVTKTASHVRDGLDLKRMMFTVVIALIPCMLFAIYNTGYQAQWAIAHGAVPLDNWRSDLLTFAGFNFTSTHPIFCLIHGALYYLPIFIAVFATGGIIEPGVAMVRKHEVNEGFLVTGMLLPLTLPPTISLWMVVLGMAFGVVFGKEIFGGTGMNFLNPALVGRAFLFFAYPAAMSGDAAWIAADFSGVDSFSGATLLAQAAVDWDVLSGASWSSAFFGLIPGSMGETSAFLCLLGAGLLLFTQVGSFRNMSGVVFGTVLIGGNIEAIFAIVRKHEINEGFFVTWFLFPLVLPPTIPLWQVAMGIAFGVLFGKEIFGGTGMNILNPALTARAFLFFAYPGEISGDKAWIAAQTSPDGYSGATPLANAAAFKAEAGGVPVTEMLESSVGWANAFWGTIPGSMGETSALACMIGAGILLITQVGSWRTMAGVTIGTFVMATLLNAIGSDTNPMMNVPFSWHIVLGGWALGTVYMATDPVSSSFTDKGRWIYGFSIGVLTILIRCVNPAYPEGMMLAILFMNMFAPMIDYFALQANIRRRLARDAA
jgi:Na(+)-translocating NADH:ubiquinone oxidoreductase B subunit